MVGRRDPSGAINAASGKITITAQQSRFHTETDEDNAAKEITVKDLSISLGNRELLSHAEFQLQRGRKYVLHGRNGIGKSTLLRAIASDQIPNIPRGVKVLLLGQTESTSDEQSHDDDARGETVLQHVIKSDRERERLLREARTLTVAFEHTSDPTAVVREYRRILVDRLVDRVEVARQIATLRSGARGAQARKVLNALEDELVHARANAVAEVDNEQLSSESQKSAELLGAIQTSLEMMDASSAEAKARTVLLGLGFSAASIDAPRSNLSGGWRTRCSLASALCQSVDLLLLDEPTNFLDLPSIIWLEHYIQSIDETTTVLVVTHDRMFGDEVAEELLVLREQKLERFRGTLSQYENDRLKTYRYLTRMQAAQDKQKKHIQATIEGNVQAAKRAGDDKKLKQAASRKKKLDERMGIEVSAKGTRFKLNRDLPGYHTTRRGEIEPPKFDPPAIITIDPRPAEVRVPGSLVSLENVTFAYNSASKTPTLRDVNLTIHPGDRVGLCGLNGSGKSTLVSLIMGTVPGSSNSTGSVTRHMRARFGMYSQQAVEELDVLAKSDLQLTALSHLMEHVGPMCTEKEARATLSGLGLVGRTASDVPIGLLSGGQKVRLALAKVLYSPPHLLILDEVTTHLDTDTIQALVLALKSYEGAILLVTHDRFFMRCVVEGESLRALTHSSRPEEDPDEEQNSSEDDDEDQGPRNRIVFRLSKGKLSVLERGMEQYEEIACRSSRSRAA